MNAVLPWIFTSIAVSLSAAGHIYYKSYALSRRRLFLILTGLTFILVPAFSFLALRNLTIAQVYLCTALIPVLTTIGAKFFIKEIITRSHIIGLILITTGTLLYVIPSI